MEIKATCRLDLKSVTALSRLGFSKRTNPQKKYIMFMSVSGVLVLFLGVEAVIFSDFHFVRLLLIALAIAGLESFVYFGFPRITYRSLARMKNVENIYTFTDDCLYITTASSEYNSEGHVAYTLFGKVYETSQYFFLYQTNNQVLVVDKSTLSGGTAAHIREKLSGIVKKYVMCNY